MPFTSECSVEELSRLTIIDEEECKFLVKLKDHLQENSWWPFPVFDIRRFHWLTCYLLGDQYAQLKNRHQYEKMLYWGHQLFSEDWDPVQVHIREVDSDAEE